MTKKQREQVVELLRCSVDEANHNENAGIYGTATQLGLAKWDTPDGNPFIWKMATNARKAVDQEGDWLTYEHTCLEAAMRVEEGSWP